MAPNARQLPPQLLDHAGGIFALLAEGRAVQLRLRKRLIAIVESLALLLRLRAQLGVLRLKLRDLVLGAAATFHFDLRRGLRLLEPRGGHAARERAQCEQKHELAR